MNTTRRRFLQAMGAAAAVSATPSLIRAATGRPHVVVVGGGFAGATTAKYLRAWSGRTIDVTLIEPNKTHTSCVLSNLVLNRRMALNELEMSFASLTGHYGVKLVQDRVTAIEAGGRVVRLQGGSTISCDRLVVATGIGFDTKPSVDFDLTPHAWIAGEQTNRLARQVNQLRAGDTFVMTVPKAPYRCPPGPYERACLVADIFKRKGLGSGDTKVILIDENDQIQAERHTFENAFTGIYGGIIEYIPGAQIGNVDSRRRVVETSRGDFHGKVVNFIPRQRSVGFVRESGLTNAKGWAGVDPTTYESTNSSFSGVHIIGDSQATGQPKSAHMANAQAKVCTDAIIRSLEGKPTNTKERLNNITTNSACYSPITYDEASWLTANFSYENGAMKLKQLGEAEHWSRENYDEMFAWASNLFTDSFH